MKRIIVVAGGIVIVVAALVLVDTFYLQKAEAPVGEMGGVTDNTSDRIRLISPLPNTKVTSPLVIRGEARGPWYFEAVFPVVLVDASGKTIAEGHATAKGEWMTTEFVPFEAILTFTKPQTDTGKLILKKDNPSGLPEHDDSLVTPVFF